MKRSSLKLIDTLTIRDLEESPVWRYASLDGDPWVRPVERWPVEALAGKLIGSKVKLANGSEVWAIVGNVDPLDPRLTQHLIGISIERDGKWFSLARYHDVDRATAGPAALASFLEMAVPEVFPIAYDVRRFAKGDPAALAGVIQAEPQERLTLEELMRLDLRRFRTTG
jgi:hypothetical protein